MLWSTTDYRLSCTDYQRIEQAILFLEKHYRQQPSLKMIADSVGLSEYHFQRLFTRWAGISPKRFMQFLTKEHAKRLLANSVDLLTTAYQAGLSGPGRLHDLFITYEAMTPGEYKSRGHGLQIVYGFHACPFGECLLALTERGICNLIFLKEGDQQQALLQLKGEWPKAELREETDTTFPFIRRLLDTFAGDAHDPFHLYLNGTNFQIKVWEALMHIPSGSVVSYKDIAVSIGMPGASRAVGSAVARNPLPVIIPCHRVLRQAGDIGGYRWGIARKRILLGWEAGRAEQATKIEGAFASA